MEIPFSRWHAAISRRRSRRSFDSTELESSVLAQLETICREFRPFPQARAELVTQSPDRVFKGAIGPYGKIKGAPAFIAFIGDMNDPHIQEKVGYLGEGIILEATAMNLDTCWVAGFFRPKVATSLVGTSKNERILSVTPVGHATEDFSLEERIMTGFGLAHRRKPLTELVTGLDQAELPHWMKSALEAARLAPSAINRQPWRFYVEPCSITVSVDSPRFTFGISKRLDCGIAMLHIEVAALDYGVQGKWESLQAPQVARFTIPNGK
jgi:nitroreductase